MKELALNNCRLDKRYDITDQLGRGSYAQIYLARDILASHQAPHREVVIKALNVFLQDDLDDDLERTLVENFQNEAVALDRVRHPNIISRLGHGTASDLRGSVFHYLVVEYLPGGDMQTLVRKRKISIAQALDYIEQVCAGLGHAHKHGVIHRDIKPQNLLLTGDHSTVKIADFGVARVHLSDSPITRVGTNIYAPPEHSPMLAGHTGTLDYAKLTPAADVYSLAKSFYTIVSGEAPRGLANEELNELPASVRNEKWAECLTTVLRKATHRDPRRRHQSVEEFWIDLGVVREFTSAGGTATVNERAVAERATSGLTGPFAKGTLVHTHVSARNFPPQAHVSQGYTPLAPAKPQFEAVPEIAPETLNKAEPPALAGDNYIGSNATSLPPASAAGSAFTPQIVKKKRIRLRRFAAFAVFIILFTGALYGTASYMRGRGVFPEFRNPFKTQTAVANTDIYLRGEPNTDNDPIGLVTKNSKMRIVKSQNNWYQVDVLEQGRDRNAPTNAKRGWLNGKYIDIDN